MVRVVSRTATVAALAAFCSPEVHAQSGGAPSLVTIDNYLVAETHYYTGKYVKKVGIGKFSHARRLTPVDPSPGSAPTHGQDVIRMNRDTLYSFATFDLTSSATVTFPDAQGRFMSLEFISEGHDVFPSVYEPGQYLLTRDGCGCEPPCRINQPEGVCTAYGTRFGTILARTLVDPDRADDVVDAHSAQDQLAIDQASPGEFDVPEWDEASLRAVRDHLIALRETSAMPTVFGFFTGPERIDHLYGALNVAAGWGGVRATDQTYILWQPDRSVPAQSWTMIMPHVPLVGKGFWSITVYNKEGYMFANPSNYNSAVQGEAGLNPDGSTTVYFGDCTDPQRHRPSKAHCLAIQEGWNIVVRFFRPSQSILNGTWTPPPPFPTDVIQV